MNEPSKQPPVGHGPQIYAIAGAITIVVFGYFLVARIPTGGSIMPPVAMVIGALMLTGGLIAWARRRRKTKR
jgi:LPXTG-motif cell wall-anchored protein